MKATPVNRRELLISLGLSPVLVTLLDSQGFAQEQDDKEKMVDYLFVQTAGRVSLKNGELRLGGIAPATLFFSDRPERIAGHLPTETFVSHWGTGGADSFESKPPNAALSILSTEKPKDIVVTLKKPRLHEGDLSYTVDVIDGDASAAGEASSLFIDVIGLPLTPASFAGSARRVGRRTSRRVVRRHCW